MKIIKELFSRRFAPFASRSSRRYMRFRPPSSRIRQHDDIVGTRRTQCRFITERSFRDDARSRMPTNDDAHFSNYFTSSSTAFAFRAEAPDINISRHLYLRVVSMRFLQYYTHYAPRCNRLAARYHSQRGEINDSRRRASTPPLLSASYRVSGFGRSFFCHISLY